MDEQKRRMAAARAGAKDASGEPGISPLPISVEQLRTTIILWHHVVAAGDYAKAADLHTVLTQWVLRVAACDPRSTEEAKIKAAFLTRDLVALEFTLPPPAKNLVDAVVNYAAEQLRPASSCQA